MPLQLPRPPSGTLAGDSSAWGNWANALTGELERFGREQSQSPAALRAAAGISFVASPPLNLYVSKIGTDTASNGFNGATPCLTLAYALSLARDWNVERGNIVINLGSGTWAESIALAGSLWGSWQDSSFQGGQVIINGNGAANTTLSGEAGATFTVCASFDASIGIQNLKVTGMGTGQSSLFAQLGGLINVYAGVEFGAASAQILHCENTSQIQLWNDFTISGSAGLFALADSGGLIEFNPPARTVTITGTPAFSTAFIGAQFGGIIYIGAGWLFSGAATGPRHYLDQNAVISNNTGSALPGNASGTTGRGGSYSPPTVPTVNASTGLGTGGAATIESGSGSRCGSIFLNAGSAATAATGTVQITFNNELLNQNTIVPLVFLQLTTGPTTSWNFGAAAVISGFTTSGITIAWDNAGAALAVNQVYRIGYFWEARS